MSDMSGSDSWGGPPEPIRLLRDQSRGWGGDGHVDDHVDGAGSGQGGGTLIVSETTECSRADPPVHSPAISKHAARITAREEVGDGHSQQRQSVGASSHEHPATPIRSVQDPPCRERPSDGAAWPRRDALSFTRSLVFYGAGAVTEEHEQACRYIEEARTMRKKYNGGGGTRNELCAGERRDILSDLDHALDYAFAPNGVVELFSASDPRGAAESLVKVPHIDEFVADYGRLVEMCNYGAMRSFCFQRLQMLTSAFKMHVTANSHAENEAQSNLLGTDFYRTMKVDNHIHLAGAPTAKQFVNFVRDKLENEGDTVVFEDGQTLSEVFKDAGLDSDHLTIDAFSVLADYSVYQRFDNFNSKYSPFRMAQMRKIFLKVSKSTRRNSQVVHFSCSSPGCLDHFGVLSHKHLIPRIIPLLTRWRITSKEDFSRSSPRLSWPGLNNQRDTIQLLRCGCRFMGWNEKNGSTWPSGCSKIGREGPFLAP